MYAVKSLTLKAAFGLVFVCRKYIRDGGEKWKVSGSGKVWSEWIGFLNEMLNLPIFHRFVVERIFWSARVEQNIQKHTLIGFTEVSSFLFLFSVFKFSTHQWIIDLGRYQFHDSLLPHWNYEEIKDFHSFKAFEHSTSTAMQDYFVAMANGSREKANTIQ